MTGGTALGWRAHSGWAVLVVVAGTSAEPQILERARVELLEGDLPRQPYHAAAEGGLGEERASELIGRVEDAALERAAGALTAAVERFGVTAVGVVGGGRAIPGELHRVLAAHALLHAAEGDLYEQALAAAAGRCGLPVHLEPAKTLAVPAAVEASGRALGPPWQKDHKLAAAVAFAALARG